MIVYNRYFVNIIHVDNYCFSDLITGLKQEGIYRISPSVGDVNRLKAALNAGTCILLLLIIQFFLSFLSFKDGMPECYKQCRNKIHSRTTPFVALHETQKLITCVVLCYISLYQLILVLVYCMYCTCKPHQP